MTNKQTSEEIFKSAIEMMDSIRAVNGEKYARTVETALNTLKIQDLVGHLLAHNEEAIGREKAEAVWYACNRMFASLIGLCTANADLTDKADPHELIDWAQKLKEIEERGAKALIEERE